MKKSIPPIDELINRLSAQIEARHEGNKISESGKHFLKEKWLGNEEMLYETVKSMENEKVKFDNMRKSTTTESVTFCTGVDFLGFPTYTTHKIVFYSNPKVGHGVIDFIQYDHKENYNLKTVTSSN